MILSDRMKDYESRSDFRLQRKVPVIGRLDGKASHTLTRGLERPFDESFHGCMVAVAAALCENVQGCQAAYTQSDEVTVLLLDTASHDTQAWFDYRLAKMCSVAASVATDAFSRAWRAEFGGRPRAPAWFDARFFNVAQAEVCNAFLWRQRDAERNSLLMLAQAHFSHLELQGKRDPALHDMLHGIGVNWNDCPARQKRGTCVVREQFGGPGGSVRSRWVGREAPIFSQDRDYIERYLETDREG